MRLCAGCAWMRRERGPQGKGGSVSSECKRAETRHLSHHHRSHSSSADLRHRSMPCSRVEGEAVSKVGVGLKVAVSFYELFGKGYLSIKKKPANVS